MKRVLLCAWLAACGNGTDEGFPVEPGGPGGSNTPTDAAVIDAVDRDALSTIAGRVCLVTDLRTPTSGCANTGADNLTVTLGTKTATTTASGTFTIERTLASNPPWRVTGANITPSVMPFGASNIIPAIELADYVALQGDNGVVVAPTEGTIVARIVKGTVPQAGVVGAVSTGASNAIHYDGSVPATWPELATGSAGTIWIPGVAPGAPSVTATRGAATVTSGSFIVEAEAITFVILELP